MMQLRRRRRIYQTNPNVSLTPLIDTALTLLVVFMVAAPVAHHAVRVDLPHGESAESTSDKQQSEIIITIDRDGLIYMGQDKMKRADISAAVQKNIQGAGKAPTIYLQVDRRAEAGIAIELLTDLRGIEGVDCVAFTIDNNHAPT